MLYSTVLYSTMLYSTMLYSTVLYSTMLYSTTAQCVNCTPGAASTEAAASTPGHPGTGGAPLTDDAHGSLGLQLPLRVRTDLWRVALQLLMVVMCLAAVAGNLLVVVIIAVTKQFHSVTSVFLVNLAVSDFLVGVGVMPFVAMSVIYDGWVLQQGLCLYVGYTCTLYCTASVLTLAAIALDRYRAIIDCFNYSSQANVRRTVGTVGWIWVQAALSSSPPALGWGRFAYSSWAFRCAVDSASSPGYTVFAAACSFALPACVMIFCYVRIVQVARDHARRIHDIETQLQRNGKKKSEECEKEEQTRRKMTTKKTKHKKKKVVVVQQEEVQEESLRGSAQPIAGIPTTNSLPGDHLSGTAANLSVPSFSSTGYNSSSTTSSSSSSSASSSFEHPAARVLPEPHSEETPSGGGSEPATRARSRRHDLFARYNSPGREHHGAFRLFLVIFAFFCCWLPYEVVSLALAVRPAAGVPYTVLTLASWLALLNSAVNPLLYALLSQRFRKALGSLRQRLTARLSLVVGGDRVHSSPFAVSNATNNHNHQQQQQQRELSQQQHHVHHQQTFQQLSLQHHHHHHNNNHQLQQDEHHAFNMRDHHLNNHHNQLQHHQQQQVNTGCCRRQSGNGNAAGAVPMSVLSEAAGELRCGPHGRSYSLFSIASLANTGPATPGISPIFHQLDPPAHPLHFSGLQEEAQLLQLRGSVVGPRGCEHSEEVLLNPLELETCLEEQQQQQQHMTLEVPVLPFQPLTNGQRQLEHRTADDEVTIATTPSSNSSSPCPGSTFRFGKITVEVDDCETRH